MFMYYVPLIELSAAPPHSPRGNRGVIVDLVAGRKGSTRELTFPGSTMTS